MSRGWPFNKTNNVLWREVSSATVVGKDRFSELAVLRVEDSSAQIHSIERGDSENPATVS
ncbi:MAG: hypothetical protein JRN20_09890 [Nitrososphaerota archaeon]|nr:hypothetical protein [Nitrososphaerota archaeon]